MFTGNLYHPSFQSRVKWSAAETLPRQRRFLLVQLSASGELPAHAPVMFVNWYEAEAWCSWAKRRLPTEAEWEVAAVGQPTHKGLAETRRRWPWGEAPASPELANLELTSLGPLDVAACAAGDSAFGCRQMIGNVWEWTASDFLPFAGFSADPYEDYSQPWFNTRKVLRGLGHQCTHRASGLPELLHA
jgi:iron(II)-dependent oxidoreductase